MLEDDVDVMRRVMEEAVQVGRLPSAALAAVDIRGIPPTVDVRDHLQEAQADQILVASGAMSVQTMGLRHGLDPDHELKLITQLAGKMAQK